MNKTLQAVIFMSKQLSRVKYGKKYIFLQILQSIFYTTISIIFTIIPGQIINELVQQRRISYLFTLLAFLGAIPIISHIFSMTIGIYIAKLRNKLILDFNTRFQQHIADMDYEMLENPEVRILKQRASINTCAPLYMLDRLIPLFSSLLSILALFTILITLHPVVVITIIVIVIINSVITNVINKKNFEIQKQVSAHNNAYYIHHNDLSDTTAAKENRLYDTKNYFIELFTNHKKKIDELSISELLFKHRLQLIPIILSVCQQFALYIYLIHEILYSNMLIGTMTIYLSAIEKLTSSLGTIANQYLGIVRYSLDIDEYSKFTSIPASTVSWGSISPVFDKNSVIEFRNVSFKYPGSNRYAIRNLNIKIHNNQKLCIVGLNGSGKTTFIKLLVGLYSPSEGEILLNNIKINNYNLLQYRKLFAPVFQDFYLYNLSISDNIALSQEVVKDKLDKAIVQSGLDNLLEKLDKSYNTQIFKNLDESGIDPSGGEGQRIAIARALYHDAPIYLLDEPTASLDPQSEYEIYTRFNDMISNNTAILITHRLSAVQLADNIAVFEDGKVIEYGTHSELYSQGGIYTEMFDKQAQFYRENPAESNKE